MSKKLKFHDFCSKKWKNWDLEVSFWSKNVVHVEKTEISWFLDAKVRNFWILGFHCGAKTSYTSKKLKSHDFCSKKWEAFGFRSVNLEQKRRTYRKKLKSCDFARKMNFRSSFESLESLRNEIQKFRVNLEGFLLVVREKSKKRKRCNFFRRVRRFCIKILSFFDLRNVFQSYSAFQSKKGNVSWRKIAKSEKWSKFPPFGLCFSGRDEIRFLASSCLKPCANQRFH